MSREEALKIVLSDVCCSNGKDFCKLCPLSEMDNCEDISYDKEQLLEAIRILVMN